MCGLLSDRLTVCPSSPPPLCSEQLAQLSMAILSLESLSLSSKLKDRKPGWRLRFWIFLKSQRNQELFLTRQLRQNEQYHFDHGRDTVPIFIVENCLPLYKGNNQEGVGSWPFPVTKTDHPTPVLLKELHCVFPLPLSLDISPTPSCWCLWYASSLGCQRESSLFCPCI